MHNKTKTAIITGGNGFIGQHLVKELERRDITPIILDRHDLYLEVPQLTEILFSHRPQYIFALHAYGNHRNQTDVTKAIMANYFGTYNLLKASEFLEYEAFINVGSSSMYGRKMMPMSEQDYLAPDTFYAATKAGAMYLARAFALQYAKPIATIIPFSVYGEGEANHRFVPQVIKHLVSGESMVVVPDQMHDWIHVDDFVSEMLSMVDNISNVSGEMVNSGTGIQTSNTGVIALLEEIAGKKLVISEELAPNVYDSPRWRADRVSTDKILLDAGLKRCWEYYTKMYYTGN